jgi:hypothetical protein
MATCEVRNGRLYVGGEAVAVDRRVIATVIRRFEAETGRRLPEGPGTRFLPPSVVERILAVDRALSLTRLQAAVTAAA